MKDNKARSNAYWQCGGIGHFHKDCTTSLPSQGVDRNDKSIYDTSSTIGHICHTLTASTSITDFTFKVISKKLVSFAWSSWTFSKSRPIVPKGNSQPSMGSASLSAIPAVTAAAITTTTQAGTSRCSCCYHLQPDFYQKQLTMLEDDLGLGIIWQCLRMPNLR